MSTNNDTFEVKTDATTNPTEMKAETKTYDNVKHNDNTKQTKNTNSGIHMEFEPVTFTAVGKTTRMFCSELCHIIKENFALVFHDLVGVNIPSPSNNGKFHVELFFEYNNASVPEGKIRNLNYSLKDRGASVYERMHGIYAVQQQQYYTLTDETKLMLGEFMPGGPDNNKVNSKNWNNYVVPIQMPDNPMNNMVGYYGGAHPTHIVMKVIGLNIHAVLRKIFGKNIVRETTTEIRNGEVVTINHNSPNALYEMYFAGWRHGDTKQGDYIVNIVQFDEELLKDLAAKENPYMFTVNPYYS